MKARAREKTMKAKIFLILTSIIILCALLCACQLPTNSDTGAGNSDTSTPNQDTSTPNQDTSAPNQDTSAPNQDTTTDKEPEYTYGTSVGEKLPSYEVSTFDENGLTGKSVDPTSFGRVTVVNFWGIWCPPCVGELPEFSEVAEELKDTVTFVAIHTHDKFSGGAVEHIKSNYSDSQIIFAKDKNTGEGNIYYEECYEAYGGNGYYPYTIILDENGIIVYAKEGALSRTQLLYYIALAQGK